jgi:hypothetical protein
MEDLINRWTGRFVKLIRSVRSEVTICKRDTRAAIEGETEENIGLIA